MTVDRSKPDISLVIVSWNTRDLLRACLKSVLENSTRLQLEVFVVDNASTDGSAEMTRSEFAEVCLVENSANVGFARANNQALPKCTADNVLLLNPDTIIIGSALHELLCFIREHTDCGAVGPKLIHPRAGLRVLGCGNQPTLWRVVTHYSFLSSFFPKSRTFEGIHLFVGTHDQAVREVEWLSGACLLVRRSALMDVGGLCEDWFMYAEDWELCARLRANGWRLCHLPSAVVEHHLSASTEQNELASMMPITAGRSYFIKLNKPSTVELFTFDAVRSIGLGLRAIGYFVYGLVRSRPHREMWFRRARTFRHFARAALPKFTGLQNYS
jgi:GT2 family glycosyltransferase